MSYMNPLGYDPYNYRPVKRFTTPTDLSYPFRSTPEQIRVATAMLSGSRLALDEDQPRVHRKVVSLRQ